MESLHKIKDPIPWEKSPCQPPVDGLRESLSNLQGNILRGHGRNHSVHIFLQFHAGKETKVKEWIKGLAERITSTQQQLDEPKQNRGMFRSFFLSASGYKYLGLDFSRISSPFDDEAFLGGMKKAQWRLHDPETKDWDEGYQKEIHAMVLLAHDQEEELVREKNQWLADIKAHADRCAVERGKVIRNAEGKHVEHFGYIDSRSHPLFIQSDIEWEKQKGGGISDWDPSAGPASVLVPDPYGRRRLDSNGLVIYDDSGSYLVFRKLEQNVRAFKDFQKDLAQAMLPLNDEKRAGALVTGRFEEGTPVVLPPSASPQSTTGDPSPVPNNFNYEDDPHGQKCPFQAHIRKVNPRKKGGWIPRIVRRGITYGERKPDLTDRPLKDVGVFFMCYQKNIKEHFEFIQSQWANNPDFPQEGAGIDPIIGQHDRKESSQHRWPAKWDEPREKQREFNLPHGRFVTLKGGEYFFAPSKHFLRHLGEG